MEGALCGLLVLLLVRAIDPAQLQDGLRRVTFGAAAGVICFQLTLISLATWCWSILLAGAGVRRPWLRTLRANLAGFAVTYLTPAVTCSGAPVRAALYRDPAMRLEPIFAAIAMDTFILAAGKIPTIVTGAAFLLSRAHLRPALAAGGALLVLLAAIVAGLLSVLRGGRFLVRFARWAVRPLALVRRRAAVKTLSAVRRFAAQLDRIGRERRAVRRALGVAALIGGVEVAQNWFVLSVLGVGSIPGAFALQSGILVQGIIGILPGNIGGMEAVNAAAVSLLGLGPSTGIVYSLILRIGQLSLVVLGLGILIAARLRSAVRAGLPDRVESRGYPRERVPGI